VLRRVVGIGAEPKLSRTGGAQTSSIAPKIVRHEVGLWSSLGSPIGTGSDGDPSGDVWRICPNTASPLGLGPIGSQRAISQSRGRYPRWTIVPSWARSAGEGGARRAGDSTVAVALGGVGPEPRHALRLPRLIRRRTMEGAKPERSAMVLAGSRGGGLRPNTATVVVTHERSCLSWSA
jgi:hypothetical protein